MASRVNPYTKKMKQKTLKNTVKLAGRGLHTGQEVAACVYPAEVNHGLIFKLKANNDVCIPATIQYVDELIRGTTLAKDGVKIYTVEHLISALYGLGIDNALIEVNGNEIPILDGSAKPWVDTSVALAPSPKMVILPLSFGWIYLV